MSDYCESVHDCEHGCYHVSPSGICIKLLQARIAELEAKCDRLASTTLRYLRGRDVPVVSGPSLKHNN